MSSSKVSAFLTAVRVALVAISVGLVALVVLELASMPSSPLESDGFAYGMAGLLGGIIVVLALGLAAVAINLPTLLGRNDSPGFDRRQKLVLKGSGVLNGGGLVAGLAYGFLAGFQDGVALWFGFVVLASLAICATLVWRLGEIFVGFLSRLGSEGRMLR